MRPLAVFALLAAPLAAAGACGSNELDPIHEPSDAAPTTTPSPTTSAIGDDGAPPATGDAAADAGAPSDAAPPKLGGCKRGIAANAAPGAALAPSASQPGVSWWYNWAATGTGNDPHIAFVPMIWGSGSLSATIPSNALALLGFNEPNFKPPQSNLTPKQAAAAWPEVEAKAAALGIPIVSPAVNYCGGPDAGANCSDPSIYDPYTWLKGFFTECSGCKVDYVAVHWYNCDLPSLKGYIDGNGKGLQGFIQFNKPIWLTEFSCDGSHSAADQKAYMQAAIPYLEGHPQIARYSWFSAKNIASALLANTDGTLTDLGKTYVALPQNCP